jgi:hypothetical protein
MGSQRLQTGGFKDAEEVILRALQASGPIRTLAPQAISISTASVFEQGLGLFGSPEDAALVDDVVSIAYVRDAGRVSG